MQIPSPGADCPAIVTSGLLIFSVDFNVIFPESLKMIIREPLY